MKRKGIVSLIIAIMMIMCTIQHSQAATVKHYYNNGKLGVRTYKQVNAFRLSLSDSTTLADAGISTNANVNIEENIEPVEIVLILDNSTSMAYRC